MSILDDLLFGYRKIFSPSGAEAPTRDSVKFIGTGVTVADNPSTKQTEVTISTGSSIAYGTPVNIGTANADGAATAVARADHVHDLDEATLRTVAGELTTSLGVNGQKITNLGTPTANTDAVTKAYADGLSPSYGTPVNVGTANSAGVAATAARSDHVHALSESTLRNVASGLTNSLQVNNQNITMLADGVSASDAATYGQVLALANGLDWKASVRAMAGTTITPSGAQTIDGVACIAGDRVLLAGQGGNVTTPHDKNGIYVVAAGAWSRATDADSDAEVTAGMTCFVSEGTTYGNTAWTLTTNDTITLDSTLLQFTQSGSVSLTYGSPANIGTTASDGVATSVARSDHVHDLTEATFRSVAAELTASLAVNSQKITALADGTAATDAATYGQISALNPTREVELSGTSTSASTVNLDTTLEDNSVYELQITLVGRRDTGTSDGNRVISVKAKTLAGVLTIGTDTIITEDPSGWNGWTHAFSAPSGLTFRTSLVGEVGKNIVFVERIKPVKNPSFSLPASPLGTYVPTTRQLIAGSGVSLNDLGSANLSADITVATRTVTTASFTQPAAGSTVVVSVSSSVPFFVDQYVFVNGGGLYQVTALPSGTSITLRNLGHMTNAAASATVAASARVMDAGVPTIVGVTDIETSEASPGGVSGTPGGALVDLATVGPVVSIYTGSSVVVTMTTSCTNTASATPYTAVIGVGVTGATTIAAASNPTSIGGGASAIGNWTNISRRMRVTGLTPGLNTFTMKYYTNYAFNFRERSLVVESMP